MSSVWPPRKQVWQTGFMRQLQYACALPSWPVSKTSQVCKLLREHPANSKQCPAWEKEKKILKIKCEHNISFPEARKQYEQFYDTRSYASAVKPGTCNKSTQTDNKSTQTDDSFTEYLKNKNNHHQKKHQKKKHLRENKTKILHLLVQGQHLSQQL